MHVARLAAATTLLSLAACQSPIAPAAADLPGLVTVGDSISVGQADELHALPLGSPLQMFRHDFVWRPANDPTVPDDVVHGGSFWPLVLPSIEPSRLITCGVDGTSLHVDWQPGGSAFVACLEELARSGVPPRLITRVLMMLGANDVALVGPTQASYFADLQAFARVFTAGYPQARIYVAEVGHVYSYPDTAAADAAVVAAIHQAWTTIPNVRPGPVLQDIAVDADGVHFRSEAANRLIAARWVAALGF